MVKVTLYAAIILVLLLRHIKYIFVLIALYIGVQIPLIAIDLTVATYHTYYRHQ